MGYWRTVYTRSFSIGALAGSAFTEVAIPQVDIAGEGPFNWLFVENKDTTSDVKIHINGVGAPLPTYFARARGTGGFNQDEGLFYHHVILENIGADALDAGDLLVTVQRRVWVDGPSNG